MLSVSGSLRVFLATEPVDLRKSFNGLHGIVLDRLGEDPCSGALFVFTNKRRNRIKALYFDLCGVPGYVELASFDAIWRRHSIH